MDRLIGAHVSASGGLEKTPARAAEIGANALQFFTSSPRTWQPADPKAIHADAFYKACALHGIEANVIHAIYLVNLASDKPDLIKKSHAILKSDLEIAAKVGAVGVVVHLGSHQGRGYEAVRQGVIECICRLLDETPEEAIFLIENSAGQKGKLSSDLAEIRDLIEAVDSPRLRWCFDTCHAHAAGYDLGTRDKEQETSNNKHVLDKIEELGLLESLAVIHVNDSRDLFDSGRDRHENLGEGEIDSQSFQTFLTDARIRSIPLILEVPGFDKKGPDAKNVNILKTWINQS